MDNNPEGTPNPLNPNPLDANPSEPVGQTNKIPVQSAPVEKTPIAQEPTQPAPQPLTEELVEESVMVESLDPEGRPMEKAAEAPAPKKKKKTGLIIGLIVCLFIAVGCGVAAALMLLKGDSDPVSAAMKKLMSGNLPQNVVVDGKIDFATNKKDSPISKVNINLDVQIKTNSLVRSSETDIALTFSDNSALDLGISEVYSEDGDIYFKAEGFPLAIQKLFVATTLNNSLPAEVDCSDMGLDGEMAENCKVIDGLIDDFDAISSQQGFGEMFGMLNSVLDTIDGEWVRISASDYEGIMSNTVPSGDLTCLIDFVEDINTNSKSAIDLYNKNPFLSSTTENITIDSKFNQVHQIAIDNAALANFINEVSNSSLTEDLYDCLGFNGNVNVSEEDIEQVVKMIPAIYVEVDKDNNFTRLYMEYATDDNESTVTIDLSFSYPSNITISEPEEYITLEEVIQSMLMNMYDNGALPAQPGMNLTF